ncbi:hypothetical protein KPH14_012782 [Odynerus spinipes]|uniref:Uncharacterized protein n=1 Tax=Odynerus spinipes TaxID=1348599 RepID=A0AAD9RET6_9HYME|nr:hypothetical protein KPH14_012782 [Odynerus spinipes]
MDINEQHIMNHENETENSILKSELRDVKNNFTQAVAQINVMQRKLKKQQQQQKPEQPKQEQQQQPEQQEETTK